MRVRNIEFRTMNKVTKPKYCMVVKHILRLKSVNAYYQDTVKLGYKTVNRNKLDSRISQDA